MFGSRKKKNVARFSCPNRVAGWRETECFDAVKTSALSELDRIGIKPILRPCRECEHQRQSQVDKKL